MEIDRSWTFVRGAALALLLATLPGTPAHPQTDSTAFRNLQVLPKDITPDRLNEIMLGTLLGLGLRRLQGEGCLYCHVGDMEQPGDQWDYAADDKPTKRKARVMMAMVQAINGEYLSQLTDRIDMAITVSCYTCHAGRTDPRPLPDLVLRAYVAGGIDSATAR
jgi:hypothetical protein